MPEPGYAEARGHTQLAQLLDDARHKAGDFDLSDGKTLRVWWVDGTQISVNAVELWTKWIDFTIVIGIISQLMGIYSYGYIIYYIMLYPLVASTAPPSGVTFVSGDSVSDLRRGAAESWGFSIFFKEDSQDQQDCIELFAIIYRYTYIQIDT